MKMISLQVSKEELDIIERAQAVAGFRSRSEYTRQATIKQAKKDLKENDET